MAVEIAAVVAEEEAIGAESVEDAVAEGDEVAVVEAAEAVVAARTGTRNGCPSPSWVVW